MICAYKYMLRYEKRIWSADLKKIVVVACGEWEKENWTEMVVMGTSAICLIFYFLMWNISDYYIILYTFLYFNISYLRV